MAARLKVYRTPLGFYEAVVAAPSQKAALAAFDVRENLFASGMASVTDDPDAVEPALARPGVVLRRPAGGKGQFSESPDAPQAPAAPKRAVRPARKGAEAPPPPKPPDRSRLDAAEDALEAFELDAAARLHAMEKRREALEAEARDLRAELAADRKRMRERVEAERAAYRKAAG